MSLRIGLAVTLLLSAAVLPAADLPPRVEFTRLIAHFAEYHSPEYLRFVDEVQPEIAQVGWYGAHFYSLAHTPHGAGYPAHFPVVGLPECGAWFENLNRELHKRNAKAVGHFNVEFLVGDPEGPEGPRGFFKFYRDLWDEKELGPKPVADPLEFLQRDADGKPIVHNSYSIGGMKEYWACLNNPQWRTVLKAWMKVGVRRGADGFIANYFYRHNCLCPHCVTGFKDYLRARFPTEQLREKFGIADLNQHKFTEIVGWHDPKESTPLRREMLRFSQLGTKAAFDEVFVKYGRSLKSDLIVGQWNHIGDFGQINVDERCMLPAEVWGRDEDYLWYSTGGSAHYTDLENGELGDGTLRARYIRGTFDDKPFTLGKYESTRARVAISELAANGGAAMGFYATFSEPLSRAAIVQYYRFLRENNGIYQANRPHAEVVLLFPRSSVQAGDVAPVDSFKLLGKKLLDDHVLFDVLPDDMATPDKLKAYRQVIKATETPTLIAGLSRIEAPKTVRVSVTRPAQGDELTLHFVNYNRKEPAEKKNAGRGFVDDNPIAVESAAVDLSLPAGFRVVKVEAHTPEAPAPVALKFETPDGRLRFTQPKFPVYGVARIQLEPIAK